MDPFDPNKKKKLDELKAQSYYFFLNFIIYTKSTFNNINILLYVFNWSKNICELFYISNYSWIFVNVLFYFL